MILTSFLGESMEGMQFDAGTWWLAVLLLSGVTALLFWLLKRSYDRVERKADGAVPKAEFDKQLDDCKAQIQEIQKTYTSLMISCKTKCFVTATFLLSCNYFSNKYRNIIRSTLFSTPIQYIRNS